MAASPDTFYGRGASWPLRVAATGGIGESAGIDAIEESIRIILGTQYGERVMRPQFGCNLRALAFAPNNAATAALARHYVVEGLQLWEPRVEVTDVVVENDLEHNALVISVLYRVRSTQTPATLVYPFYLGAPGWRRPTAEGSSLLTSTTGIGALSSTRRAR